MLQQYKNYLPTTRFLPPNVFSRLNLKPHYLLVLPDTAIDKLIEKKIIETITEVLSYRTTFSKQSE